ncbi:hypothetical protein [Cupriavidus oxalaticus]|nr:hypothetical protein [Cupriavidus oxalaticus]
MMNPLPFAQVSAARQINLEVLRGVSDVLSLTEMAFSQFETLMGWNLQWIHGAIPGSYECTRQLLAMHRPRDILAMQTLAVQLASGKALFPPPGLTSVPPPAPPVRQRGEYEHRRTANPPTL